MRSARQRSCTTIAAVALSIVIAACSGGSNEGSGAKTSVSWQGGTSTKGAKYSGIGLGNAYADLVVASFTPSTGADAVILNPVNADFKTGDWLYSGHLIIKDGKLEVGTYSGPTLPRSYLYYFDSTRNQTYNQYLSNREATVNVTSVSETQATGTVTITDQENGYAISTGFKASIRKI